MTSQESTIFPLLIECCDKIKERLSQYEEYDEGHRFSWENCLYRSSSFRRAHLDIVDVRDTRKLYMAHLTVFPHVNDPSPIFGFDIIAGPNKVTGAFHDFSPVTKDHRMSKWFSNTVSEYEWSKPRVLPDWAKNIFSSNMIAAGNIHDPEELKTVLDLVINNLDYYLQNVGEQSYLDYGCEQNYYCKNQKKNPHTPRVMASLGLDPEEVEVFVEKCLFPELTYGFTNQDSI